jgi:hypothetical protein
MGADVAAALRLLRGGGGAAGDRAFSWATAASRAHSRQGPVVELGAWRTGRGQWGSALTCMAVSWHAK